VSISKQLTTIEKT